MVFRQDINGLRAWAVTLVVLFHFGVPVFSGGFLGVDIFFVISGFLMAGILIEKLEKSSARTIPKEIITFYLARARRILPALLMLCLTAIAAGWLYLSPTKYEALANQVIAAIGFYSNALFLTQSGYFDSSSHEKILLHTWSLSVEWQFYIALPLYMSTIWLFRKSRRWQFSAIFAACAMSFGYCLYLANSNPDAAFYSTFSRAWEMLVGSLVYFFTARKKTETKVLTTFGFVVIIFSATILNTKSAWPNITTLFPVIATALIIYSGSNSYWTSGRLIQYIGDRSYSIYLWHWPVVVAIKFLDFPNSMLTVMAGISLTLILAEISFKLIETKARTSFLPSKLNPACLVSLTLILFVVLLGDLIRNAEGYPNRFPASASDLAKYRFLPEEYREGQCFLRPKQTYEAFNNCVTSGTNTSKTILLWGDSHAAHLYPGVLNNLPENRRIAQFTASGCPPFIEIEINERPNCKNINKLVEEWIVKNQPDEIILAARWSRYNWKSLNETLSLLRKQGIKKIIVFGPTPVWSGVLTDILLKNALLNGTSIPDRERLHLISDNGVDEEIRKISQEHGAEFVSIRRILCNPDGCITYLNTKHGPVPTAWDTAHLSSQASDYLIMHSRIFK